MHRLHAFPFACSLAVHATLLHHQQPLTLRWEERGLARKIAAPDFAALNPKRKVPTLVLPDGDVLTEIVSVLDHLEAEHGPERSVRERRLHLEWLSFVATELHQQIAGPAYDPDTPPAGVRDAGERLWPPLAEHLAVTLGDRSFLAGDAPSAADFYLAWALMLILRALPDGPRPAALKAYLGRVHATPAFGRALTVEREALGA